MAYPHDQKSIRRVYEERFPAMDSRQVTLHRVVNIVDERSPMPRLQVGYDRRFDDDQWYGGPQNYRDARECYGDEGFPPNDRRRYFDDNPHCNFRRNISQNEGPSSPQWYGRDDLRHQLDSRNSGGSGPHFQSCGQVSGLPRSHSPPPVAVKRRRRAARPPAPVRSRSNTSSRSFSHDREKGFPPQPAQQRYLPSVMMSSVEESTRSSGCSKEKASVAETEEAVAAGVETDEAVAAGAETEEATAAGAETEGAPAAGAETEGAPAAGAETEEAPAAGAETEGAPAAGTETEGAPAAGVKLTPEEAFQARWSEAVIAKVLEIETQYRSDCETFCIVVKMLLNKEPRLGTLLEVPLAENLSELKDRYLDALKEFVEKLPDTSA
uniref:Periphilin-1 C-terminal domain-containing protein n=1 Tax=Gasterosteus aculeatus aculeatus TaxID=481459 RepID=G3NJ63_GASAC